MFISYPEVVNYLLQTYANYDATVESDAAPMRYIELSTMPARQYAEALVTKSLCCGEVYDQYILKRISIKGPFDTVRNSMQSY